MSSSSGEDDKSNSDEVVDLLQVNQDISTEGGGQDDENVPG